LIHERLAAVRGYECRRLAGVAALSERYRRRQFGEFLSGEFRDLLPLDSLVGKVASQTLQKARKLGYAAGRELVRLEVIGLLGQEIAALTGFCIPQRAQRALVGRNEVVPLRCGEIGLAQQH
jgi:hypothetical protein